MSWALVTDARPDEGDFPVLVVKSRDRDRAVWTRYREFDETEDRRAVAEFFDNGENVYLEEWYAKPS